ncbi:hypothetical protein FACS1894122_01460 [Alphaproteobacteria bacterium]|nr:hypothetical protein FACS1894122_01460 [Alphaproteobacteria bacterium]
MNQEVFIPIKVSIRKGRRAIVRKPGDQHVNTQFSRLLAKAQWLESQLEKCPEATLKEFCEANKISPRYVRSIMSMNRLSPKIKRLIMDGYAPNHLSVQDITNKKLPMLWKDQEAMFVR